MGTLRGLETHGGKLHIADVLTNWTVPLQGNCWHLADGTTIISLV